jgi:hypothetical protein
MELPFGIDVVMVFVKIMYKVSTGKKLLLEEFKKIEIILE